MIGASSSRKDWNAPVGVGSVTIEPVVVAALPFFSRGAVARSDLRALLSSLYAASLSGLISALRPRWLAAGLPATRVQASLPCFAPGAASLDVGPTAGRAEGAASNTGGAASAAMNKALNVRLARRMGMR